MSAPMSETFVREIEKNNDDIVRIHQLEIGDVGCVVWDAALVLSKYLETPDFNQGQLLKGKQIIELGAGTGVVGIIAGTFGANVIITDLPEFISLINMNIEANKDLINGDVTAQTLTWGVDSISQPVFDYVFLADCIYYEQSLEPLVQTIEGLCRNKMTTAICCYEQRTTGNKPELERKFFEESDKRPLFGPLRKVLDASSDVQTYTNKTVSVSLGDGSGEPTSDNKKTSNKEKTGAIPGWYNIQQWTEQYERQLEMPKYTGYCVRNEEYRQHLDSHCESGNRRTDIDHYPADVYWADESYYRSTQEIRAHSEAMKTDGINQEIDEDIADLAAELLRGGSVLEVADNMAVRLDCPQWKNRIDVSRTCHPRQPTKTRKMKLPDNSDVLVNLIETGYLLQNRRPTSNTKTPSHTPALPVQRHNTFSTIPYSTNALLQRSLNKVNFLSSKQRSDPGQPLFRQKSDCEVNFSTYWNGKSQSFFFCANRYHPKTSVNLEQQSISTKVPSCSAAIDRKRKSSSDTVAQPPCKRPPTVSTKRPNSSGKKQSFVAYVELFTVPVFILSKTARFSTADHPPNKRQH